VPPRNPVPPFPTHCAEKSTRYLRPSLTRRPSIKRVQVDTTRRVLITGMASAVHQRSVHTSSSLALTPQARNTFQSSFDKFEHTVKKLSKDDQRDFSSTGIQDVWKAARELEQQLAARQSIRNLRRIEPLLHGLEKYSKVVEVLCNGTPYLPWLWVSKRVNLSLGPMLTTLQAPIKLLLKVIISKVHFSYDCSIPTQRLV
jgi:hypothetical protein